MSRSRIQNELEALKKQGLARSGKEGLKDAVRISTPEEDKARLKKLVQKYKRQFVRIPKPSLKSPKPEWDKWYLQQRAAAALGRKQKEDAAKLLHHYRGVSSRGIANGATLNLNEGVVNSNIRPSYETLSKKEQNVDLSIDDDEADEELHELIASMENLKDEEVQAMLLSADEDMSINSGSTPSASVKNGDNETSTVGSNVNIEVIPAETETPPQAVEEKAEEPTKGDMEIIPAETPPQAVEEKEEEPGKGDMEVIPTETPPQAVEEKEEEPGKGDIQVIPAEKPPQAVEEKEEEPSKGDIQVIPAEKPPQAVEEKEEEPASFQELSFRDTISKDENAHFPAEKGRYELYVSPACPRSHETLVVLALKGLTDAIGTITAEPILQPLASDDETEFFGWVFPTEKKNDMSEDGTEEESPSVDVNGSRFKNILEIYQAADDTSEGKFTLPILWDTTHRTIVNNNFYDILRILNSEFNDYATYPEVDLYPQQLKKEIASFHTWMYDSFTNGVYQCAVATTQESYIDAVTKYTEAFDKMESILSESSYLIENTFTIVDICLFCSLFRLDEVYSVRFYLNTRSVRSSESMKAFCKQIYSMEHVKDTCDLDTIKKYYFGNAIVPDRKVIPVGPSFLDYLL